AEKQSDVTVVSLHFGTEYERLPNERQKEIVQKLADEGVDIIIGHHPHVLQPIEWVEGEAGNETFVVYSLGNFLSGQNEILQELGGILQVKVTKTKTGDQSDIQISNPEFVPTWVDQNDYQIIPLEEAKAFG